MWGIGLLPWIFMVFVVQHASQERRWGNMRWGSASYARSWVGEVMVIAPDMRPKKWNMRRLVRGSITSVAV